MKLILLIFLMTSSCYAALKCDAQGNLITHSKTIEQIKEKLIYSIDRKRNYVSNAPHKIFKNTYDFHSSVIAHLSLYQIAHYTNDKSLLAMLDKRLRKVKLNKLKKKVINKHNRQKLYAISWLIRLLDHHPHDAKNIQFELAQFLIAEIDQDLDILDIDGSYDNFHLLLWNLKNSQLYPLIKIQINNLLTKYEKEYDKDDHESYWPKSSDFLNPFNLRNLFYLSNDFQYQDTSLPSKVNIYNVHTLGRYISEYWYPLSKIQDHSLRKTQCEEMIKRIQDLLSLKNMIKYKRRKSFTLVSHWIPQYIWQAIYLNL